MDADSLARAAGRALVSAMTTDAWLQACTAIEGLYQGLPQGPDQPDPAWLFDLHRRTQAAVQSGGFLAKRRLRETCAEQLLRLLRAAPRLADDLQRVLQDVILPTLSRKDQQLVETILRGSPGPAGPAGPPIIVRGRAPRDPPIFRSTDFRQHETSADLRPPSPGASAPPPAPPPAAAPPPPAASSPAPPSPAPQQERPQLISTGFTAPGEQAGAIASRTPWSRAGRTCTGSRLVTSQPGARSTSRIIVRYHWTIRRPVHR